MITKHIVRNVALRHRLAATFMPKPMPGEPGNGMHFHIFFVNGEERIFFCSDGYCSLSATARSAIAGILHHAPALCAFTNPSVNSYHRLVPNQEAPVYRFFSGPNRSAAIRVPSYARSPEMMRFEYRVPDGSCNPYLCMGAIMMAAIDGVRKNMVPEDMGFGPIDENVFARGYDTSRLPRLPESLDDALDSLEGDRAFLEEGGVFEPDLIDAYLDLKRDETARFRGNPHPLEHFLYFNL
jgi:glutamine synthetase